MRQQQADRDLLFVLFSVLMLGVAIGAVVKGIA